MIAGFYLCPECVRPHIRLLGGAGQGGGPGHDPATPGGEGGEGPLLGLQTRAQELSRTVIRVALYSFRTRGAPAARPHSHAPWPAYLPKGAEILCPHEHLNMGLYSSFTHNC